MPAGAVLRARRESRCTPPTLRWPRIPDWLITRRCTGWMVKTFAKAGVADIKAGTRRLRHNAASRLLAVAVPLPTISAVLGHASGESTNLCTQTAQHHRK